MISVKFERNTKYEKKRKRSLSTTQQNKTKQIEREQNRCILQTNNTRMNRIKQTLKMKNHKQKFQSY
jgi:hypothetical protein